MRKSLPTNRPYSIFPLFDPSDCRAPSSSWVRSGGEPPPPPPDVGPVQGRNPLEDFAFFEAFDLPELLRATAWRTSAFEGGLVSFFAFVEVDRAAYVSVETRG